MTRALLLAVASAAGVIATAAPIPVEDDAAKLERHYGRWTDPEKDCRYKLVGDVLTIALPEKIHYFAGIGKGTGDERDTAPTVLKEVTGDFTAVVRVTCPLQVPRRGLGICSVTGGLLVRCPNGHYYSVRQVMGSYISNDDILARHDQRGLEMHSRDGPVGPVFVRIRREGPTVRSAWSRDEKAWQEAKAVEAVWPATVRVGVVAENSLRTPADVVFDRYSLTQPKK